MASRILLATIGSLGDLHPMLALGRELARRGHEATIATTAAYRPNVGAAGLRFHPIRPNRAPDDQEIARYALDLKKGPEFLIRDLLMPNVRDTYADLAAAARAADLLVAGEIVFAAPLVAERFGLPWAAAILSPLSFFSAADPSVIAPVPSTRYLRRAPAFVHRLILQLGRRATRRWMAPVHELRRELGLRRTKHPLFEDKFSPFLNLAMFSPVLGEPQPDWPPRTKQTGFVFYDARERTADSSSELEAFLAAGEPPIVFTLGSAAIVAPGRFFEESIAAARALGRRAVLLVGPNAIARPLPPGVAAFEYVPFSQIFPRASAVVHQGGAGTTAQALAAGVPQLVMPYGFDQPDNAARLERLGVARTIARPRYTGERAARLLGALSRDRRYAERAAAIATEIDREHGARAACDEIDLIR